MCWACARCRKFTEAGTPSTAWRRSCVPGCLGVPDLGITGLDDVLTDVRRITDVCALPLLAALVPGALLEKILMKRFGLNTRI